MERLVKCVKYVVGCIVGRRPQKERYIRLNEQGRRFHFCYFHVDSYIHHKVVREYANGDVEVVNWSGVWQRIARQHFEDVDDGEVILHNINHSNGKRTSIGKRKSDRSISSGGYG